MDEWAAISGSLDALEAIQADLAEVATRADDQRRQDLINLRRRLAAQIAEIGRVSQPVLMRHADAATMTEYRAKFSQMRSAAALHQADWPAVLLGEREAEYRASAQGVREANREFVAWLRGALGRMNKR
ncbi:hypothetical protein [Sphingomonas sp.]|jgi:hypothetical protein|uniref:hypothetical protein n=1 Tax=Sphingomonas sp. TaxID=28214 RepID=UPI002EDAC845